MKRAENFFLIILTYMCLERKQQCHWSVTTHHGLVAEIITMHPSGKNQHGTLEMCSSQYGIVQMSLNTDYNVCCVEKNKCERRIKATSQTEILSNCSNV